MGYYWYWRVGFLSSGYPIHWSAFIASREGADVLAFSSTNNKIYKSFDFGQTYEIFNATEYNRRIPGFYPPIALAGSSSGYTILASSANTCILWLSTDGGYSFTETFRNDALGCTFVSLDASADGSSMIALSDRGLIYLSNDTGQSWLSLEWKGPYYNGRLRGSVAMSSDGQRFIAGQSSGYLHIYGGSLTPSPTIAPSVTATSNPSIPPTSAPSRLPTQYLTHPTISPSQVPPAPSKSPSVSPSILPTRSPSEIPSFIPTPQPSLLPTTRPTPVSNRRL